MAKGKKTQGRKKRNKPKDDDALSLAEDLNLDKVGRDHSSDSDLLDSERDQDDDRELTTSQFAKKRKRQKARDEGKAYQQVKHVFDI
jgi:midasin (ATPase involved in ribosome maturation)